MPWVIQLDITKILEVESYKKKKYSQKKKTAKVSATEKEICVFYNTALG